MLAWCCDLRTTCGILRTAARSWTAIVAAALLSLTTGASAQEMRRLDDQGKFQQQPVHDPKSPEGKIDAIRKALADKEPGDAEDLADEWIEQHPNHPLIDRAYLLRGDAKMEQRDYYDSLFDYEYLIRSFPSSEHFHAALEREFRIAKLFAAGVKRKLWGMEILDASGEGEELFIRIQERAPGSEIGERASLALANYYYDTAVMHQAATAYDLFLQNYPNSLHREQAMRRQIQASLATFKGPRYDPTGLLEAGARLKAYQAEYPSSAERLGADALIVRIDESLALKAYYTAQWYETKGKNFSAAYLYKRVAQDFPRTAAAEAAMQKLAQIDPKTRALLEGKGKPEEARDASSTGEPAKKPDAPVPPAGDKPAPAPGDQPK